MSTETKPSYHDPDAIATAIHNLAEAIREAKRDKWLQYGPIDFQRANEVERIWFYNGKWWFKGKHEPEGATEIEPDFLQSFADGLEIKR